MLLLHDLGVQASFNLFEKSNSLSCVVLLKVFYSNNRTYLEIIHSKGVAIPYAVGSGSVYFPTAIGLIISLYPE